MEKRSWWSDVLKGIIGAIVASLALSVMQYLGAHIGDVFQFGGRIIGAVTALRVTQR